MVFLSEIADLAAADIRAVFYLADTVKKNIGQNLTSLNSFLVAARSLYFASVVRDPGRLISRFLSD
jgi:hypothetical protein